MMAPALTLERTVEASRKVRWYSLYGLRVRSAFELPIAPLPRALRGTADVVFEAGTGEVEPDGPLIAQVRCHPTCEGDRAIVSRAYQGAAGTWLWSSAGMCLVSADACRVTVYPDERADPAMLGLVLAGQVAVFVLHKHGYPTLHSSAVVTEHGVVAFLGQKGQGKSTMAAAFLQRGAPLLTDDALALVTVDGALCGIPGLAHMKLWPEAARRTLGLTEELPNLLRDYEKRRLDLDGRFELAQQPARLRAFYVLQRYTPAAGQDPAITIHQLGKRDGFAVLMAQTSWRELLQPRDAGRLLPCYSRLLAQAPVSVLAYPDGFEYQTEVHRRILADVAAA